MEPNDLKSPPPDDAALEAWLRTNASLPALPDHGFSARVLVALPRPARRRTPSRLTVCLGGALVGTALAGFKIVGTPDGAARLPEITPAMSAALAQLSEPGPLIALAVTALSLAYVFWSDLRRLVRP